MHNEQKTLDISWASLWKIFGFTVLIYVLYQIKEILIWFIFALVISILFDPAICFLRKLKIPRFLAVAFIYTLFFGGLILFGYFTTPIFIDEIKRFVQIFPQYFEKFSPLFKELGFKAFEDIDSFVNFIQGWLGMVTENIFSLLFLIFGGIFSTIFIITLSLYLSLEEKFIEKMIVIFFPKKYEDYLISLWHICEEKVTGWFFTRILSCFFVGIISFLSFLVLDVHYAFLLSILAAALNFVPIVGPLITGILIFLLVALDNFAKAIFVIFVFIIIQQIENNIFTPLISKKFIGLSPALVLLSLSVGGILFGFLGAFLAIPLAGILFEFLKEFLIKKKLEESEIG